MDLVKVLSSLRERRERLAKAIVVLEYLDTDDAPRRGRPKNWAKLLSDSDRVNMTNKPGTAKADK